MPPAPTRAERRTVPVLFGPLKLRGLTLRNRVWLSPMCQYAAGLGGPGEPTCPLRAARGLGCPTSVPGWPAQYTRAAWRH